MHPLEHLSNACRPADVTNSVAFAALVDVATRLRRNLQSDLWPRPWQMVGLAYCELAQDRCIVADDQGLGKTGIALCRVLLGNHPLTVIVSTASMFDTWRKEINGDPTTGQAGWLPVCPVHSLGSEDSALPPPGWRGIIIVSWTLLASHVPGLIRLAPSLVIADESHYATNPETTRTMALRALTDRAPGVLLLTGTPINNRATDLWELLWMLDSKAWPSPAPFEALEPGDTDVNDALPTDAETRRAMRNAAVIDAAARTPLQRKLSMFMLRRLKRDAIPKSELPDKEYRTLRVVLTERQRAEYDYAEQHFADWLEMTLTAKENRAIAAGQRPGERSIDERVDAALKSEYLVKMGYLRRLAGRAKVRAAVEWTARMVANGEPVVVFAEHRDVISAIGNALRARGIVFAELVGKVSKRARGRAVAAFQGGRLKVILASTAGREGITLTNARHALHVQWWWTPTSQDQASDRLHRIGQKRQVQIWRMSATDTIDTRLTGISERKRGLVESLIGNAPINIVGTNRIGCLTG